MAWVYLFIAGLTEIAWAIGMKQSEGFTRLWPSLFTLGAIGVSLLLLSLALRGIPIGTAYAVWAGIGTVGTAVAGILFFSESTDLLRLASIGLIAAGIVGLKLVTH
ncbi:MULTISPECIES: quaternary ammonium compound efflux SMR transporter SugE [Xanthobacter]|uniref:Guanidinium exporter n=1 Tax=Xanthobacter flavus TaxID=281 RepID=A0A9W6FL67_XANFL|nr:MULTISPECIES: quaternary ammonium compound efflux SMR transporter SugE [Xanthobacter]MBN8917871.1 quaternary ammonium compound efflux SMR transporter SugE [Hyphomicrobiales bacterium]MDR6332229.1 quaternary ammonium compound-resistance protein SugE [Xanthobacter flavus]NMN56514.1 quaternary ammonium compound-resistance protein SugE [Xanthobacter sp. SG618]UDQ88838.1 quaternary ammonium compound efflux SMR transporter SugE [Xanthobacter autotrophicus]UJX45228.1 quaternary ammonium compound-r